MIDAGEWRTLTSHQKHRVAILKPETTLAQVMEIAKSFGDPFKGEGQITATLKDFKTLEVHAMWYPNK